MRSFFAVASCVFLLVCASFAAPSVKLPQGYTAPANAKFTGEMIYNTLAYSQNTLPRGVDVSLIATHSNAQSTLLGSKAKRPASLVIIPEDLAPKDVSGALEDNSFPITEMSVTLSTAIVLPGLSTEMKDILSHDEVQKIIAKPNVNMAELSSSLANCGVQLSDKIVGNSFTLNGVDFDAEDMQDILYASAVICSAELNNQVTVVDLRSAYDYAKTNYGSITGHVQAVESMIRSVVEFLNAHTTSFVLATNNEFFMTQRMPNFDYEFVSPRLTASLKRYVNEKVSSPNTGMFQITLWFTIFIVIVVIVFAVLTCGVGIDIEKDTLLYQTTALRGQPVL